MSIYRWMDKEGRIHIHNGILLSYKKERMWLSSNEVDEPRAYYIEWRKTGREKHVPYINAYMWNLESWYWWIRADDGERPCGHGRRERVGPMESAALEHIQSPCADQVAGGSFLHASGSADLVRCDTQRDGVGGGREVLEGGTMCACGRFMLVYRGYLLFLIILYWGWEFFIYSIWINPWQNRWFGIFLSSCGLPFHFLDDVLWCTKKLILVKSSLLFYSLVTYAFWCISKKPLQSPVSRRSPPVFPSKNFADVPVVAGSLARFDPTL